LLINLKHKGLLSIHLAVLLFGLAGLFGKLIILPAVIIVLGRVSIAAISIAIYIKANKKISFNLSNKRDYTNLLFLGILLAFHWFSFFHSIQLSTVAIGLLAFSSFPVFTAFLEPFYFKESFEIKNIILSLITLLGIFLVVPKFDLNNDISKGAIWGIFSGLSFALLTLFNRKYVQKYSAITISFYQNLAASIILFAFLFIKKPILQLQDIGLLILLGTLFTAFSHIIYIKGLETIKARTASIISSLEPVYGIVFAIILLGEIPAFRTIIGGLIILGIALYVSLRKEKSLN